jgi:hypothetical protein
VLTNLLQWWNLIFLLPFAGAAVFMLVQGISGVHSGEAGAEHEIEADHDVDHDHAAEHSTADKALLFLGVGRVPVSTLVSTMGVLWGISGWITNQALEPVLRSPLFFFPISFAVALAATTFGTRWAARAMARLMPATETSVTRKADLVDSLGRVRFKVTQSTGSVMVTGPQGHLQEVSCRVKEGREPIPSGASVILFEYDETRDLFYVAESNLKSTGGELHNHVEASSQVRTPKERIR